jgi:hypothetical protein
LKWYEKHAIIGFDLLNSFNCQPCLAAAAGTDQRQQSASRVVQQRDDLGDFVFSPDERCRLRWEVMAGL